jgi:rhodanese-related sulfurtransferase
MLAENVPNGDMPVADWLALDRTEALVVDMREHDEFAGGRIPNAINAAPAAARTATPSCRRIGRSGAAAGFGQRAYFATRFLAQHGYRSQDLSGGYTTYQAFRAAGRTP